MEYNVVIREYRDCSLSVVARVLLSDFQDLPTSWTVRYKGEDVDRATRNITDLCCGPRNPIHVYKPGVKLFPVVVRTMEGESFEVTVSPTDTKKVLKWKIFQARNSCPPQTQNVFYCDPAGNLNTLMRFFSGYTKHTTLDNYGISRGSNVWLKINHAKVYDAQWDLEPWLIDLQKKTVIPNNCHMKLSVGVNICGKCTNPFCPSKSNGRFLDVVAGSIPYGRMNIDLSDRSTEFLSCSVCALPPPADLESKQHQGRWPITPEFFIVHNARADLLIKGTSAETKVYRALLRTQTRFEVTPGFRDAKMELSVVEPWKSPFSCVKCDTKIMFAKEEKKLPCGHFYHSWCAPLFASNCCICSSTVVIVGKICDLATE